MTATNFWTPSGRTVVELDEDYLGMLNRLAAHSNTLNLGLQCTLCGHWVGGENDTTSRLVGMNCACRMFIGKNPERQVIS